MTSTNSAGVRSPRATTTDEPAPSKETTAPGPGPRHVANPTPNRHGISGYLSDPVVARRIHDALTDDR
jgi:hypothetical protein